MRDLYIAESMRFFSLFFSSWSFEICLASPNTQLKNWLEDREYKKNAEARSIRNVDRTVKDLETQLQRRDK